jgi:uncharacterized membrane protein
LDFEYLIRFSHLVAGIAWIGSSFYFIWLDSSFTPPEAPRRNVEGELYMVHGGFYYQVDKRKIYPGELPKTLHWFKWEATLTWTSGFALLIVVYFLRGASLLIDPRILALTQLQAIMLALAAIAGSTLLYDTIWNPKLIRWKPLSTALSFALLAAFSYLLSRAFSGRGAFILAGASFGSMMLWNVWVRILPGQAKMLREAQAGQVPDYSVSLKSKTRSVHNTYFTFPVLFIMLSNHYPTLTTHPLNWLLLLILFAAGALTRHAMVTKNPRERWALAPAVLGFAALIHLTAPKPVPTSEARVEYSKVRIIFQARCFQCHSERPTDDFYKVPPNGIVFETEDQVRHYGQRIYLQVVLAKTMPLANKTKMTPEERTEIQQWLKQESLTP